MRFLLAAALASVALSSEAGAQALQPGDWDVKSTVVQLAVPGVPGFMQRMAKGRSKAERKRIAAGQGIEALLAPNPTAHCKVESQHVEAGRYAQALACPQKNGEPMRVTRAGTYDASGFAGRATVAGTTPKGPMSIVMDQRATRVGS